MTEEVVKHDVVLENSTYGDYFKETPSHVLLILTEKSIQTLQAARKAYEAAAAQLPGEFVFGIEIAFRSFDYMVANEEVEPDESGEQPLEQWDDNWELSKLRVNQDGFRIKGTIKHVDINMESEMLTFAQFEEELRKFRALQLGASLEEAMPGDDAAPSKRSGLAPI